MNVSKTLVRVLSALAICCAGHVSAGDSVIRLADGTEIVDLLQYGYKPTGAAPVTPVIPKAPAGTPAPVIAPVKPAGKGERRIVDDGFMSVLEFKPGAIYVDRNGNGLNAYVVSAGSYREMMKGLTAALGFNPPVWRNIADCADWTIERPFVLLGATVETMLARVTAGYPIGVRIHIPDRNIVLNVDSSSRVECR